jgi:hypothetical protein
MDSEATPKVTGTGFFVAPGRVLSCAHVVPAGGRYVVVYQGIELEAEVMVREPDTGAEEVFAHPDVALLAVYVDGHPFEDHPCVPFGTATPEPEETLYSYGCPSMGRRAIWEHMTLRAEGEQRPDGTDDMFLKTKDSQVRPGASGSGVVAAATGELVGMLIQTRDAKQALGGALIPTSTIVHTLKKADQDVTEANRKATCDADTLAGTRRRLRWVLQTLVNDLANAKPEHWRSMLLTLDDNPPDPVDINDAAFALLNLELDDLGKALRELARACRSAEVPRRLLGGAASFAWWDGRPLVEPDTARQLAAERKQIEPRVVHLPVGCARSVDLHATRAAVDSPWRAFAPAAPDGAEIDPATGLPALLVRAVRCELLGTAGVAVDETDPEDIDRKWARRGERSRSQAATTLMVVLPANVADTHLVTALRREFAPCLFVLAGPALSAALRENPAMLSLPLSLGEQVEREADERYGEIGRLIEWAAR